MNQGRLGLHFGTGIEIIPGSVALWSHSYARRAFRAQTTMPSSASENPFGIIAEAIPGIIWAFDSDGICQYVSSRWSEYTGAEFPKTDGPGVLGFVHSDDVGPAKEVWKRAVESGQSFETELRLRRHDGVYRWHRVRAVPDR